MRAPVNPQCCHGRLTDECDGTCTDHTKCTKPVKGAYPCAYCRQMTAPKNQATPAWFWPGRGWVTNCLSCSGTGANDPTPGDAYLRYEVEESKARAVYRDWWLEKFAKEGIVFSADDQWSFLADIHGYKVKLYVWPSHANGTYLSVTIPIQVGNVAGNRTHDRKIKSESGFRKLLRDLERKSI